MTTESMWVAIIAIISITAIIITIIRVFSETTLEATKMEADKREKYDLTYLRQERDKWCTRAYDAEKALKELHEKWHAFTQAHYADKCPPTTEPT